MVRRLFYLMLVFIFVSSACTIFSSGPTAPTPTVEVQPVITSTTPPEPTATTKPVEEVVPTATTKAVDEKPGLVKTLDDVKSATIQIIAEGTFIDPQVGVVLNGAGSGSGFIIDPSGIAVTNNHVVTGAAILTVYVGGSKEPKHAKVLGVSECSDLAVIDIDGDGYPFVSFSNDAAKVGTDVYAAGFPLGDPEFTLTKGIISKAKASGESNWASVENVLEHDAAIKPGNSGGPLVNANGQVVGVNYAGYQAGPYYAITPAEAKGIIDQMESGKDVTSLGLNGQAVITDDQSLSGIWVSSVKSGSPADKAGIQAGDIVTQLEDIVLATDGTMSDYCNILRSHQPSDTLKITVLRWADQTVLTGQINGRALEVSYSFAQNLNQEVNNNNNNTTTTTGYSSYVTVSDDSGSISTEIPVEWVETNGAAWQTSWYGVDINAPAITATANLDNYNNTWDEFRGVYDGIL